MKLCAFLFFLFIFVLKVFKIKKNLRILRLSKDRGLLVFDKKYENLSSMSRDWGYIGELLFGKKILLCEDSDLKKMLYEARFFLRLEFFSGGVFFFSLMIYLYLK